MNIEEVREYCLNKKGAYEDFPFGEDTMTFKVMEKIFAITGLNELEFRVNLKCDPEYAIELREEYSDIIPGWHMNKKHWNTVYFENGLDSSFLCSLIDHSYDLIVKKLKKKDREILENL